MLDATPEQVAAWEQAVQEDRTVQVVVQDGVTLGSTYDLDSGRQILTICDGIVVDARTDLEPER